MILTADQLSKLDSLLYDAACREGCRDIDDRTCEDSACLTCQLVDVVDEQRTRQQATPPAGSAVACSRLCAPACPTRIRVMADFMNRMLSMFNRQLGARILNQHEGETIVSGRLLIDDAERALAAQLADTQDQHTKRPRAKKDHLEDLVSVVVELWDGLREMGRPNPLCFPPTGRTMLGASIQDLADHLKEPSA